MPTKIPTPIDIVRHLQTTDDVTSTKRILLQHPDMEDWDDLCIGQEQKSCCVLNLLFEAKVIQETLALYWSALTDNDHLVLEVLLRHRPEDVTEFLYETAMKRSSQEILNLMAQYHDPTPYLEGLTHTMDEEGVQYIEGCFIKPAKAEAGFLDGLCTLDEARRLADHSDSPKAIQQFALAYTELFSTFRLSERRRRPVTIQTLARLGCPGVRFAPHVCESLHQ